MENKNNLVLVFAHSKEVAVDIAKKLEFSAEDTVDYSQLVEALAGDARTSRMKRILTMSEWFKRTASSRSRKVLLWVEITKAEENYFSDPQSNLEAFERLSGVKNIRDNPLSAAYGIVSIDHLIPTAATFFCDISVVVYDQRVHILRANHYLNQDELRLKLNADLPAY